MQEDALLKAQQAMYAKHNYQKKQHEFPQENYQKKNKGSRKKMKAMSNASELLGFKFEKREHLPSKSASKPAPQMISDITLSPYYRFAVDPGDYSLYHSNPSMSLPWGSVRKLTVLADSEVRCPICLETQLLAGRANKCGHCFCWPCIIRYMWMGSKRCPVCNDSLRQSDLRPVAIELYRAVSSKDTAEFTLIRRPKGMITLFKHGLPLENTFMGMLRSDSQHSGINRICIYTQATDDYHAEIQSLTKAALESEDIEKSSIQSALGNLEKSLPPVTNNDFNSSIDTDGFYFFYQLSDGQPYYLHPLNTNMLKRQYGDYENFPGTLRGKILEIERIHVNGPGQRKYGYESYRQIAHLATNSIAYFVEVDMRDHCNESVITFYREEVIHT